jgi:hypothetical protein
MYISDARVRQLAVAERAGSGMGPASPASSATYSSTPSPPATASPRVRTGPLLFPFATVILIAKPNLTPSLPRVTRSAPNQTPGSPYATQMPGSSRLGRRSATFHRNLPMRPPHNHLYSGSTAVQEPPRVPP